MGYPIYHSQYTAAQIEASIGKTPRIKAATRTWEIWDISTSAYVDTGASIDTELFVDSTLTEAGYAADAKVTGDKIGELKSAFAINAPYTFVENKYVKYDNGALVSDSGYEYTEFVVGAFSGGTIKGQTGTAPNIAMGIAFYDAEWRYISGAHSTNTGSYQYTYELTIPTAAMYMRISLRKASSELWIDPTFSWSKYFENVNSMSPRMYNLTKELDYNTASLDDISVNSENNLLRGAEFVRKTINAEDGSQSDATTRISLKNKIVFGDGRVLFALNGQKIYWYRYRNDVLVDHAPAWVTTDFYFDVSSEYQYNFAIAKANDAEITQFENAVQVIKHVGTPIVDRRMLLNKFNMTSGALQTSAFIVATAINWLTYLVKVPVTGGKSVSIHLPSVENVVWHYRYGLYKATDKSYKDQIANTTSNTVDIPSDCGYFAFAFFACDSNGNQLTTYNLKENFPEDGIIKISFNDDKTEDVAVEEAIIDYVLNTFELKTRGSNGGYVVGADLMQKALKYTKIGALPYQTQAFCKYDSQFYATNGEMITVLDSSFSTVSTKSIDTSHSNAFQHGSSNKGYISGWNDNTVYVIDLDDVELDNTISLPTATGYTTVAVDDINNIAYIFQRVGYDTAISTYNFIAYDYANNNVLYQKETAVKFGWMQACDFYEGKIIVLYGGNDASGYKRGLYVFNTAGDVISEMSFNFFAGDEPEGVCFDRDNKVLLVSGYTGNIYKVELF